MSLSSTSSRATSPSPSAQLPLGTSLAPRAQNVLAITKWIVVSFPSQRGRSDEVHTRPRIFSAQLPAICQPVVDFFYSSMDEALNHVELQAFVRGYLLRQGGRSEDPAVTYLRCHKGRPLEGEEEEEDMPPQCQEWCPYEIAIESFRGLYWVRGVNDEHNHVADPRAVGQELHRFERDYIRNSLRNNRYIPSWWLCDVTDHLRRKNGIAPLEDGVCEDVIEEELAALEAEVGNAPGGSSNNQAQPSSRRRRVMWPRHPVQ